MLNKNERRRLSYELRPNTIMYRFLLFVALLLTASLHAQPPGGGNGQRPDGPAIFGRIVDGQQQPIPYATVALYRRADSSLVDGVTSNEKGFFRIVTQPGNYYITVSFLSYNSQTIDNITLGNQPFRVGDITLTANTQALDEVLIEGRRAEMELKLDKRVFNVGKDPNNLGLNASELLDNIPSVTVDVDGNVALRGSQNVRILINGKPSGIVGTTTDALRQLQGSMIESIEVITNPSARYEAEGDVGIINIVLKKEKKQGFNGSIDLNAGYPENFSAGVNMNWRKEWINFFTNYNITYRNSPGRGYSLQTFNLPDSAFSYERIQDRSRGGLRNNIQLGSDIYLNDKNVITTSVFYRVSDGLNKSLLTYNDYGATGQLLRNVERTDNENEFSHDLEMALNYTKTFAQKDRKWTIDLQRNISDDTEESDLNEYALDDPFYPEIIQQSYNEEDQRTWLFQTDYVHPFGENGRFEMGARSNIRVIENIFYVEQKQNGNGFERLPGFDNEFIYNEAIHAGYVQAGNKFGKVSLQAGLRGEYTDLSTELVKTQETNPREYFNLFPSANLGYEFGQGNTLQLSYSRRINRPRFRSLLPFFGFSDSRNFFSGNPDLNPEFAHSFEVNYLKYMKKGSIFGSVYYRYRTDVIDRITTVDSNGFSRIFPVNLATENNYGIEFTGTYRPTNWWSLNGSVNFYRAITSGGYQDLLLSRDTYTWTARGMSKWTIGKVYDLQATVFYQAPQETTQGRSLSLASLDLVLARDVLANKGTISFRVSDVFNSRKWRWQIDTPEFQFDSEFQWRVRQFMLNFNYRINQKKQRGRGGRGDFDAEDMGM